MPAERPGRVNAFVERVGKPDDLDPRSLAALRRENRLRRRSSGRSETPHRSNRSGQLKRMYGSGDGGRSLDERVPASDALTRSEMALSLALGV